MAGTAQPATPRTMDQPMAAQDGTSSYLPVNPDVHLGAHIDN